jgi:pyruvyl transferase EpsO
MTPAPTGGAPPIVRRLADQARARLAPLARRFSHCALIDFPNHSNVGDNAIWLGEITWLAESGIRLRYRCDVKSYDRTALAQSIGNDGVILIHGGGNLGDIWPRHQRLRETVIRDFRDRPIVQLPQTMHFQSAESLDRTRAVFDAHPDLTLLLRDETSLELARNEFRAQSLLCPDMAFYLGALPRPRSPERDIFWLRRGDREATSGAEAPAEAGLEVADWVDGRQPLLDRARRALRRVPARLLSRHPDHRRTVGRMIEATYDWQARRRVRFGCRLLASGSVVVTDRLHAHILSLLLGIPHVILDNNYGKLRRFCETWNTLSSPLVRWADAPADALAAARALLGGGGHADGQRA